MQILALGFQNGDFKCFASGWSATVKLLQVFLSTLLYTPRREAGEKAALCIICLSFPTAGETGTSREIKRGAAEDFSTNKLICLPH